VGKIASFGQGISMTLFQLASFTAALANGGTLYYLQYPDQGQLFEPKIKRELDLGPSLDVVREGMEQAVLTGTARRAKQPDVHLYGKTGTCSQNGARLGWFMGYNSEPGGIAVAILLRTGQRLGGGPRASEVAGKLFRKLGDQDFYASRSTPKPLPSTLPASIQMPELPGLH
jgi:cell division protein FtsI/penicillin-binding protein 2